MKKLLALILALCLLLGCCCALAEEEEDDSGDVESSGSWSQINQALAPNELWQRFVEADSFALGGELESPYEGVTLLDWGSYPSMDGSTVCVPLGMELARQWLRLPEEDLNGFVSFSTTPVAYERLARGEANPTVTVLSRNAAMDDSHPIDLVLATYPNQDELAMAQAEGVELVFVPVCWDAFVFVVNSANPVDGLTTEQIQRIYTGNITNWAEVGGPAGLIAAFQRPHGSGSQTAMEELVMKGLRLVAAESIFITDGMSDLVREVGNYDNGPSAIGYSYLYYVESLYRSGSLKPLAVDGAAPTPENIRSGAYPYAVNYWAVYRQGDEQTAAFVAWLTSEEGQRCVAQAGYIPMDPAADAIPMGIGAQENAAG